MNRATSILTLENSLKNEDSEPDKAVIPLSNTSEPAAPVGGWRKPLPEMHNQGPVGGTHQPIGMKIWEPRQSKARRIGLSCRTNAPAFYGWCTYNA